VGARYTVLVGTKPVLSELDAGSEVASTTGSSTDGWQLASSASVMTARRLRSMRHGTPPPWIRAARGSGGNAISSFGGDAQVLVPMAGGTDFGPALLSTLVLGGTDDSVVQCVDIAATLNGF
jgi:hypothetical protein